MGPIVVGILRLSFLFTCELIAADFIGPVVA
jgi:hypothetical protein